MLARLQLEVGEAVPAALEMEPGQAVRLGRHRDNTIVLRDEHASRWHAEISFLDGHWFIRNVGNPMNGTRLNGERIGDETALANGQEIGIGDTCLRFFAETPQTDSESTPSEEGAPDQVPTVPKTAEIVRTPLRADELTVLCAFMAGCTPDTDPQTLIRRALKTALSQ